MARKVEDAPPAPAPDDVEEDLDHDPEGPAALTDDDLGLADGVGPVDLPLIEPRRPALYQYHPKRWQVMEGQVVPLLASMPLVGGVGNVKALKGGKVSIATAVAERAKRGWTVLKNDVEGPGTSYLYRVKTASGRWAYLTRWETAHNGSTVITTDRRGFVAWLRKLISLGRLPAPKPYVLEQLRARFVQSKLELQDKVRTVPSAQVELDRVNTDLAVVERELKSVGALTPTKAQAVSTGDLVAKE